MFACFGAGGLSKKELNGRKKSGDTRVLDTPLVYENKQYEGSNPQDTQGADYLGESAHQGLNHDEEAEKRRVIEELSKVHPEPAVARSITATATVSEGSRLYPDKRKTEPSHQFIKDLALNPSRRRALTEIIRSHSKDGQSPKEEIVAYINDCGFSAADLATLSKAAEFAKCEQLLTWSSRYNLFVQWSPDKQHPWDKLSDTADKIAATLEIGQDADRKEAVVLLDGIRITDWTFKNGRFTTTRPIVWKGPTGEEALVLLELNFNVFTGYSGLAPSMLSYVGPQCQGVMWPASQDIPSDWPVSPPILVGKVNVASRLPALAPGGADNITEYCGVYQTYFLTTEQDKLSQKGPELEITFSDSDDAIVVALDGVPLRDWTLAPNNTLVWKNSHHGSGSLVLQKLPGGPFLFGDIKPAQSIGLSANSTSSGFTVFGELKTQVSRLSPTGLMNPGLAKKVAIGLQSSAALLVGDLLTSSYRLTAGEDVSPVQAVRAKEQLAHKLNHLDAVEKLAAASSGTYLTTGSEDALVLESAIFDKSVSEVYEAFQLARGESEIATAKAQQAEKDCQATREAELGLNVASATYHAAQTSVRAQEAAKACAAAEKYADQAAEKAVTANTALALDSAITAAQAFNMAQKSCLRAAREEHVAAQAALKCVSANIEQFVRQADFERLRDVAQASNIATKVVASSGEAVKGWEANTVVSRLAALQAANRAAGDAQECNKITRRMQPVAPGTNISSLSSNQAYELPPMDPRLLSTPPRTEAPRTLYESPSSEGINYEA